LLVLCFALCSPELARAQLGEGDAETRTMARDLAQQGAQAFEQKNYTLALDRFTRAHALFPAPSLSVMRARSLRELGRLVEAADAYSETQRTPLSSDAPEVFRRAVLEARQEGEHVAARMPRLMIRVRSGATPPPELEVVLDGKPVPPALLDVERPIDPGTHKLVASARGHEVMVRRIEIAEAERLVVDLPFETAPSGHSGESARIESGEGRSSFARSTWGWAAAGTGAAAVTAGVITGLVASNKKSSLDSVCRPGCPPSSEDDIHAFRTNRTLSYVSFGVGAAALGIGSYLLLTGSAEAEHVAVRVEPGSVGLGGRF
jgi:hypothetical protein